MAGGQRRSTKVLVFSAIMSALGVVMLSLGSVIEVLDLTMAQVASLLTFIVLLEAGSYWPWLVYAVTGTLAMLLLPNKFPALIYVAFSGFYPMIKQKVEPLGRVPSWIIKLASFNVALTLTVILCEKVFSLGDHFFSLSPWLFIGGNATFVLYDVALTRLIIFYIFKLRKRLRIK
jgi:hypothetical protein